MITPEFRVSRNVLRSVWRIHNDDLAAWLDRECRPLPIVRRCLENAPLKTPIRIQSEHACLRFKDSLTIREAATSDNAPVRLNGELRNIFAQRWTEGWV